MKKYDIAHSELTNCYYIMCDGKKVYDCTEQIANIRAEERAEILSELMGEVAMLNETKMTEGDLKAFAYRIKDIVVREYAQNAR